MSEKDEKNGWLDAFYDKLAEDDEGRVCTGISETACREVPGNFFKTLLANMLTSVGDRVASAKTTLPWLLIAAGAPAWCVSLLVPIRESGSMLPQMALGVWVRRRELRKGFWAFGSMVQAGSLLGIGAAAMALEGLAAGLVVLALLAVFSVGRALSSLAYKDVLGKTIPKTRRGRLQGWISAIAGLLTLAVGVALGSLGDSESMGTYLWLVEDAHAAQWIYGVVFFGLGLAHAGVRLGRKTYLVDMAEGNRRTDYVAVSNSAMGVLLLFTGLIGALTAIFSVEATLILFGAMGLVGAALSLKWKDVSASRAV